MSIAALLQAAEYLERREREAEHGYAVSLPLPDDLRSVITKRPKTKKSQGSRTTHNESEKNRRAHSRNCSEKSKEMVPSGPEASRHTTSGLLTKAKRFIKNSEERERKHAVHKENSHRDNRYSRRRSEQSSAAHLAATSAAASKRRSLSECSSSTTSSTNSSAASSTSSASSPSSISESDEVDVIGYTSNQSDTDDHSSIQSASTDSGVAMSASRLTSAEMDI